MISRRVAFCCIALIGLIASAGSALALFGHGRLIQDASTTFVPIVHPTAISPTNASIANTAAVGSPIATLTVKMSDSSTFNGSITAHDGTGIICSTSPCTVTTSLVTARTMTNSDNGNHSVQLTATQNGQQFTQVFTLNVTGGPTPTGISPSNATVNDNLASGNTITNFTVSMSDSSTFTGTMSPGSCIINGSANLVQISGTTLQAATNYSPSDDGSCTFNVAATENGGTANLNFTLNVQSAGSTIACDAGPPYIGSVPAPANAAGFTHCVANFDFTQQQQWTDNYGTHQWSTLSSWLDVCGAGGNSIGFVQNYVVSAPCSDFTIVTDQGHQALELTYVIPTDWNNGVDSTWFGITSAFNSNGIPPLHSGHYTDEDVRLDTTAANGCQNGFACIVYDYWWAVGSGCSTCDTSVESDFVEMYEYFGPTHNEASAGNSFLGPVSNPPGGSIDLVSNYRNYANLNTVVNSTSGNNWSQCLITNHDQSLKYCDNRNVIMADITDPTFRLYISQLGPQCSTANANEPNCKATQEPPQTTHAFVGRMTFWQCAGYQSGVCYSSAVVNSW